MDACACRRGCKRGVDSTAERNACDGCWKRQARARSRPVRHDARRGFSRPSTSRRHRGRNRGAGRVRCIDGGVLRGCVLRQNLLGAGGAQRLGARRGGHGLDQRAAGVQPRVAALRPAAGGARGGGAAAADGNRRGRRRPRLRGRRAVGADAAARRGRLDARDHELCEAGRVRSNVHQRRRLRQAAGRQGAGLRLPAKTARLGRRALHHADLHPLRRQDQGRG